jgi:hypothetical protein
MVASPKEIMNDYKFPESVFEENMTLPYTRRNSPLQDEGLLIRQDANGRYWLREGNCGGGMIRTEGMISILKDGMVHFKIVAGCNGHSVSEVAGGLRKLPLNEYRAFNLRHLIREYYRFGCDDCLIVSSRLGDDFIIHVPHANLQKYYWTKFDNLRFNPRRSSGEVAHLEIINMADVKVKESRSNNESTISN